MRLRDAITTFAVGPVTIMSAYLDPHVHEFLRTHHGLRINLILGFHIWFISRPPARKSSKDKLPDPFYAGVASAGLFDTVEHRI